MVAHADSLRWARPAAAIHLENGPGTVPINGTGVPIVVPISSRGVALGRCQLPNSQASGKALHVLFNAESARHVRGRGARNGRNRHGPPRRAARTAGTARFRYRASAGHLLERSTGLRTGVLGHAHGQADNAAGQYSSPLRPAEVERRLPVEAAALASVGWTSATARKDGQFSISRSRRIRLRWR